MDPAGVVIVISLLQATGGKSQRSCQWGGRVSERKRERSWCVESEKCRSSNKEKVPQFKEVLPQQQQQQPKDNHVSEIDPEVLWFAEYIQIPLSTQHYQYFKDDAVVVLLEYGARGEQHSVTSEVEGGLKLHISESRLVLHSQ